MAALRDLVKRYEQDEIITIALENTTEKLKVSKALLCSSSEYFKRALKGEWKEAGERMLKVPGCDIDTFRLFLHWQLSGSLPEDIGDMQLQMARLWIFADSMLMPKLQNAAMKNLWLYLDQDLTDSKAIEQAWKFTQEGSKLRAALIGNLVAEWKGMSVLNERLQEIAAQTPGIIVDFGQQLMRCPQEFCDHHPRCYPSIAGEGNLEQFLVQEESESVG